MREDPAIGLSPEWWTAPILRDEARSKGAKEPRRGESGLGVVLNLGQGQR